MAIIENFFFFLMSKEVAQDAIPTTTIQCVVSDEVILSVFSQPSPLIMREVRMYRMVCKYIRCYRTIGTTSQSKIGDHMGCSLLVVILGRPKETPKLTL